MSESGERTARSVVAATSGGQGAAAAAAAAAVEHKERQQLLTGGAARQAAAAAGEACEGLGAETGVVRGGAVGSGEVSRRADGEGGVEHVEDGLVGTQQHQQQLPGWTWRDLAKKARQKQQQLLSQVQQQHQPVIDNSRAAQVLGREHMNGAAATAAAAAAAAGGTADEAVVAGQADGGSGVHVTSNAPPAAVAGLAADAPELGGPQHAWRALIHLIRLKIKEAGQAKQDYCVDQVGAGSVCGYVLWVWVSCTARGKVTLAGTSCRYCSAWQIVFL